MEEQKKLDSWTYAAYATGMFLLVNDPDFDSDSIDVEYEARIVPLVDEFYYNPQLNDPNRPFLDCLNEFLENKLAEKYG